MRPEPVTALEVLELLAEAECGGLHDLAAFKGVFSEERRTDRMMLFDYGDPSRGNLVVHRCFITR